jgi:hypothetical protein
MTTRIALALILALAATSGVAQSAHKSFDVFKSLTGQWSGTSTEVKGPVSVSFRVASAGSAVMQEINHEMMISMIHLDGDRLLLTHYCAAGNQPRMKATTSPDGKSVTFDFLDATNVKPEQPGVMQRVVFTFIDANHHTEQWTSRKNGKDESTTFDLHRKKPV